MYVCMYVCIYINILYIVSTPTYLDAWIRLPEEDADASKHIGVITIYKILLICRICIYIYMCVCVCVCGAFLGLDNKQSNS
jgi:hypothetical protein